MKHSINESYVFSYKWLVTYSYLFNDNLIIRKTNNLLIAFQIKEIHNALEFPTTKTRSLLLHIKVKNHIINRCLV